MPRDVAHPLPAKDPFSGGSLVITELESVDSGVTIRGRFEIPRFARLSPDQAKYLETFLRCRGMLNSVERELGISYPTARARLDAVLKALDLHAVREEGSAAAATDAAETSDVAPSAYETGSASEWEPNEPEASFEVATEEATAFDGPTFLEGDTFVDATEAEDEPEPEPEPEPEGPRRTRDEILSMLERGEIGVDEVKKELERAR